MMFISRKELQELRDEIANLKRGSRILVCEKPSQSFHNPYERAAQEMPNSEAIRLLAKHVGVRFCLQRGPGDHVVLEPIEVTK